MYDCLKFLQKTVIQSTSTSNLTISSEKFDDTQIEQTLNESLNQCLPHRAEEDQEKQIVTEELSVINIYYNNSMEVRLLKLLLFRQYLNKFYIRN